MSALFRTLLISTRDYWLLTDPFDRSEFFGDPFRAIENVEIEREFLLLCDELHSEVPFGVRSGLNRTGYGGTRKYEHCTFCRGKIGERKNVLGEIATEEIRIVTLKLESLVPDESVSTKLGPPVKLDEGSLSLSIDENESVDSETLDHAVRARDGVVGERKDAHEQRVGSQREPVVERVVGGLRLGKVKLGFGLSGVDKVDELDTVLHEEDGDVVSDYVPVPALSVELGRETTDFTSRFGGSVRAEDGRETDERGSLDSDLCEDLGARDVFKRSVELEDTVSTWRAGDQE